MKRLLLLSVLLIIVLVPVTVFAQETVQTVANAEDLAALGLVPAPPAWSLGNFNHEFQGWNNCGPATITMGLSHFGYGFDQTRAQQWLKPNIEDKNVSPWQMVDFVNTQVAGTTRALYRAGGDLDTLRSFIANGFPVLIEAGYDPPGNTQGWMGHYLLVVGYDDATQRITSYDSFLGPNVPYTYDEIREDWSHFNRTYIVLYDISREAQVHALLGDDLDTTQNAINALEMARADAIADPENPFAWFNMGTNFVALGMYQEAAVAYDQARNVGGGLPFRMLWYQFGPFEAYNAVGRYGDTIALARVNLDNGGEFVEETFYYGGIARQGMGETERAISNFQAALNFNPNFTPARVALDELVAATST